MNRKILVVDLETTNFKPAYGSIVEVGIVTLDLDTGERKIIYDSICREDKVNPKAWIFNNSDLDFNEVKKAPYLETLLPDIQKIIDDHPSGITAYNRKFDFDFLEHHGIEFAKKLPCPMELATPICKLPFKGGYKWPTVEEAWAYFFPNIPYHEKHRGADDAIHEAAIIYELFKLGIFAI